MTDIHGYTRPGFEPVRERFAALAHLMGSGGAAFAATRQGELVVDLWAGQADHDRPWTRDTRVHIQSTSKAVTAWAAMLLVDRGELDLDQTVAHHWLEYGCHGKERTTVRQLLSHAAGSTRLPGYTELLDLDGNGLDRYDEIASRLAAAEPDWAPGTAHGYHGYTYGSLVSELVRRITGRRAGAFLRDELFGPLNLNLWLGTPLAEQRSLAAIKPWPTAPLPELPAEVMAGLANMAEVMKSMPFGNPEAWQYHAGFKGLLGGPQDLFSLSVRQLWSQPKALAAEFGSANVTADARSLARLYTPLAQRGALDGRALIKPATVQAFLQPAAPGGADLVIGREMGWTCGSHHANFALLPTVPPPFGPNADAVGMTGGGGNCGFADPAAGIAGGFVRNHYCSSFALSGHLVAALYGCLPDV
jgi:CubicO group peptidase (beta-lactamase class C family)